MGASAVLVAVRIGVTVPENVSVVQDGSRWRHAAEAGSDLWVAGERIATVPLTGLVTARLGTRGGAAIRLESAVGQR